MSSREEELWLEDKSVRFGGVMGILFWLFSILALVLNWGKLPPEIPWLYSLPWGEQQLITKNWLVIIVTSFGSLLVLNAVLARVLGKDEQLLQRILVWGGAMFELLIMLGLFRVIMVVL